MVNKLKFPTQCPSCDANLSVSRLFCSNCSTAVEGTFTLPVFLSLPPEEQQLCLDFILTGGNLKELAAQYGVSYPTIRNRIDASIEMLKKCGIPHPSNTSPTEDHHGK